MTTKKQTQFVAAISESFKGFLKETSAKNEAPLKSGGVKGASEREIGDAIFQFIEDTRMIERQFATFNEVPTGEIDEETGEPMVTTEKARDEDGNLITESVEVDLFAEYIFAETAKRMTHTATRTNKLAVENATQAETIAAMKAQIEALQAAGATV
tara:strand:+ start:1255 stop:1722 length:468 start_codon:yes stop_codon:yes gene_type:complete